MNTNPNTEKGNFPFLQTPWATGWRYRYCCSLGRNVLRPYAKINKYAGPSKIWKQESKGESAGCFTACWASTHTKEHREPRGSGPLHHFICLFIQQIFTEHMLCAGNPEGSRAGMVPASKCAGGLPTLTGSAGNSSNSMQLWGCQLHRRGGWWGEGSCYKESWFPRARLKACSPGASSFCLLCPLFLLSAFLMKPSLLE